MTAESVWRKTAQVTLAAPICEVFATIVLCPVLLAAALWNQFPIFFYDTGAYLAEGLAHEFIIERSPVYSLFLGLSGAKFSVWLPVIIQSLMNAFVMVQFARVETPGVSLGFFLGLCVLTVIVTGLPWYVGQLVPDVFTALAALSLYLTAFRFDRLGIWRAWLMLLIGGLSVAAHSSHLALGGGLVIAIMLLRALSLRWPALPRPRIKLPIGIFILGVSLVLASNWYLTGSVFISRAGSVFVFARLVQDGIVKRLLDETCPQSGYAHCLYKEKMHRKADQYLWDIDSPFRPLGRFEGVAEEAAEIVKDSFIRYPAAHIAAAARSTGSQLIHFKTGDQIEPQQWILYPEIQRLIPHDLQDYMAARQQKGEIDFKAINIVHVPAAIFSFALIIFLLGSRMKQKQWDGAMLPAFLLLTFLGNAIICGTFANPHDRYESRLVWLLTFATGLHILHGQNFQKLLKLLRSRN